MVTIKFCGAANTVTGSCFLVTTAESKFLIDCGMFQGSKSLKERNYTEFLFNPTEIDFVLLTHGHIDHCGLLPKLYKKGFTGDVYTTKVTKELCSIILPDSGHIQEVEVERKNRKNLRSGKPLLKPIYTVDDAKACLKYFKGYNYKEKIEITPNIHVYLQDAGHILGSAIIEVFIKDNGEELKYVFSGDLGNINQPIIEDPTQIKEADVIVMESTYGNRAHKEPENRLELLADIVNETMKKGGNLIIPSFAVERTQDLVYHLKELKEQGKIPAYDLYIDSPMAVEATQVFIKNPQYCDEEAASKIIGDDADELFEDDHIHYIVSTQDSIALNKISKGAIIISASGMADAGRIKHHLKHNLWRFESTVLFVGYQAVGTLGRRILEGEKKVIIHGEEVAVNATIKQIEGFSAHADQRGLINWLKGFKKKPQQVFLVHGEEEALNTLRELIQEELRFETEVPQHGEIYQIEKGQVKTVSGKEITLQDVTYSNIINDFDKITEKIRLLSQESKQDKTKLAQMLLDIEKIKQQIK